MKSLTELGIAAAIALAFPASALAQTPTFPSQTVRMIVPFSPGSMTDILARAISERLTDKWKQQVVVENRPGIAGTTSVAKSTPDGYTLMLTSNGHTIVNKINKELSFDPLKDFAGISRVAVMPVILIAPPESKTTTVNDLIAAAKAKPGGLNYGSAGLGSTTGLAAETLKQATGTDIVHVPYRGLPEAQTSVLRGDTAMAFTFFNVGGDLIQSGKLRGLAVTGDKRLPGLPNVPTFKEAGLPNFEYDAWFGIMAPAGTPKPVLAKIHQDLVDVLGQSDLRARFEQQGVVISATAAGEFDSIIRRDAERFGKLFDAPAKN